MGRLRVANAPEMAESTEIVKKGTTRLEMDKAESICKRSVFSFESINQFRYRT
jgi:hypothetical protein